MCRCPHADTIAALQQQLAEAQAENERLKELWIPCDQTVQCALCLWVDWPDENGEVPPHSDECPLGYIDNQRRLLFAERDALRQQVAELQRDAERYR